MKTMIFSTILMVSVIGSANAQNLDSSAVRQKIEARRYTFIAQSANPLRGRNIQLTTAYDLRIAGDSIIAALPYFGRAYTAPMNPSDNGINFTTTGSDYKSVYRKKRWEITIRPKDVSSVSEMNLTIYPNGRASLQVTSNNRQSISFNGVLSEK